MARIRTIKPDFWASDQVTDCSLMARLLFIGTWNFADDNGVVPLKPKTLKAKIFPADDFDQGDIRRALGELLRAGLVGMFEDDGETYLFITGWKKHQKIEHPSFRYPKPPAHDVTDPGQLSLALRLTLAEGSPPEGKGREGIEIEGKGAMLAEGSPPSDPVPVPDPQIREVIEAFDQERVRAFGPMQARPFKHPNDATDARRFLTSGATVALCREVFGAVMDRRKAGNQEPPGNLRYFQKPIADAIASAKTPMPEGRNGGNGKHADDSPPANLSKDEVRQHMKKRAEIIRDGNYLPNVTMRDVEGMVKMGWLNWEQAEKAGYVR